MLSQVSNKTAEIDADSEGGGAGCLQLQLCILLANFLPTMYQLFDSLSFRFSGFTGTAPTVYIDENPASGNFVMLFNYLSIC